MTGDRALWSRRGLFRAAGGAIVAAGGAYGWATMIEPFWTEITRHRLSIPDLPETLQGRSLVQVSDLHIGSTDPDHLMSAINKVNEFKPDILVLTGDIIDHHHAETMPIVREVLSQLKPSRLATLACLGNHDYGRRWRETDVADRVVGTVEEMGVRVLRDEPTEVDGLRVFGVEDFWSPSFHPDRVSRLTHESKTGLCLCHNPDVCDLAIWNDFTGVILSGHTHGGQCKPPFSEPPRLPVRNRRYVSGFYEVGPDRTLYINRGLGYGFKARFNCRPEITVFELS